MEMASLSDICLLTLPSGLRWLNPPMHEFVLCPEGRNRLASTTT